MRGLLHSMSVARSPLIERTAIERSTIERTAAVAVSVGVSLSIAALLFRTFHANSVDVPFYDDWTLADLLDKQHRGVLGVADFWRSNNEHRVPAPLLVMLVTARVTGMNLRVQMFESLILLCGGCVLAMTALRRLARNLSVSPVASLCLVTTFLLTRAQSNNVLWGWQLTLTMGYFFGTLALFLIAPIRSQTTVSWRRLSGGIAAAVISQYSFATGIALWPIGLLVLVARPGTQRARKTLAWAAAGSISTLAYLHGMSPTGATHSSSLSRTADYFLTQLGAPFVWRGWDCAIKVRCADVHNEPRVAGIIGLILLTTCTGYLLRVRRLTVASGVVAWGAWGVASAALTSWGRASLGYEQALLSRYVTLVVPLWGSLAILVPTVIQHAIQYRKRAWFVLDRSPTGDRVRWVPGAALLSTITAATLSTAFTWRMGASDESAAAYRRGLLIARAALREPQPTNDQLAIVFARVDEVRRLLPTLEQQHISIYRKPRIVVQTNDAGPANN